jgi:hypothetical protein
MAGLLDNIFASNTEDPRYAANMALFGNMVQGNFGKGLLDASTAGAQAKQAQAEAAYKQLMMQNMQSEMEQRAVKMRLAEQEAQRRSQFMGGGAPVSGPAGAMPMPGAAPGAMPASGGGMPGSMPQPQGAPQGQPQSGGFTAQQISEQYGVPLDAVKSDFLFNDGKEIAKMIEARSKPNWVNINGNLVNTNARGFQGGFQPGMSAGNDGRVTAWQPDGQGGLVVGAPRGAQDTFKAYQDIQEGAKAGQDLVRIVGPDGAERYVTRAQAVQASQPQPRPMQPQPQGQPRPMQPQRPPAQGGVSIGAEADRYAILTQELSKAIASGNTGDIAALQAEIARLPAAARTTPGPSGLTVAGPFQASPTTAQAAEAAAAKVRAEADARAASERQTGKNKKADSANDMLSNIWRARVLLESDPTGSLLGAGIDKTLGAFGKSTPSAANADRLESLSGWLVSNVPRMEGPQSNFDVDNYKTMAGRIGDRTYPVAGRLAALEEVERIQKKYANGGAAVEETSEPAQPAANLPKPMKGMVRNGYRYKGGDPKSQSSWEKL